MEKASPVLNAALLGGIVSMVLLTTNHEQQEVKTNVQKVLDPRWQELGEDGTFEVEKKDGKVLLKYGHYEFEAEGLKTEFKAMGQHIKAKVEGGKILYQME